MKNLKNFPKLFRTKQDLTGCLMGLFGYSNGGPVLHVLRLPHACMQCSSTRLACNAVAASSNSKACIHALMPWKDILALFSWQKV